MSFMLFTVILSQQRCILGSIVLFLELNQEEFLVRVFGPKRFTQFGMLLSLSFSFFLASNSLNRYIFFVCNDTFELSVPMNFLLLISGLFLGLNNGPQQM